MINARLEEIGSYALLHVRSLHRQKRNEMADQMRGDQRAVLHRTLLIVHVILEQRLEVVQLNVFAVFALLVEIERSFHDLVRTDIAVEREERERERETES